MEADNEEAVIVIQARNVGFGGYVASRDERLCFVGRWWLGKRKIPE